LCRRAVKVILFAGGSAAACDDRRNPELHRREMRVIDVDVRDLENRPMIVFSMFLYVLGTVGLLGLAGGFTTMPFRQRPSVRRFTHTNVWPTHSRLSSRLFIRRINTTGVLVRYNGWAFPI
jgi:hypothetical protein